MRTTPRFVPPANPYAPPRAKGQHPAPSNDWVSSIKWVYAAFWVLLTGALFLTGFTSWGSELRVVRLFSLYGRMIALPGLGLIWIYGSWRALPRDLYGARRGVSPAAAALSLLVPLYNVYWLFVLHRTWCSAVDDLLARPNRARRAPLVI